MCNVTIVRVEVPASSTADQTAEYLAPKFDWLGISTKPENSQEDKTEVM